MQTAHAYTAASEATLVPSGGFSGRAVQDYHVMQGCVLPQREKDNWKCCSGFEQREHLGTKAHAQKRERVDTRRYCGGPKRMVALLMLLGGGEHDLYRKLGVTVEFRLELNKGCDREIGHTSSQIDMFRSS
mmetsp:Transcript_32548/g.53818  ORF Transcript_32548/g.53818 Transcript_32548/m.53818 type:complete len:131 (+) Transcript_32548:209-601(+)